MCTADGELQAAFGSVQDVTHVTAMAAEVARARDLFGDELDVPAERSIIGLVLRGRVTLFDTGAERMLGYGAAEMLGAPIPPEVHDPAEVQARADAIGVETGFLAIIGTAVRGESETRRWTYLTSTGRRLQVRVTVPALYDHKGQINGYIKSGVDVTARIAGRRARNASEALFEELFDHAPSGILLCAAGPSDRGRLLRVNPALSRITGFPERKLLSMNFAELVQPSQQQLSRDTLVRLGDGRAVSEESERHWVHADGRDIWVQVHLTVVRSSESQLAMALVEDITARRDAELQLHHVAMHDQLTGLPNRYLFSDRLSQALRVRERSGTEIGLLYVDLDNFKEVNDIHGHEAGDQVLQITAHRLSAHIRRGDTVARLGGDEFVVMWPNLTSDDEALLLAVRLRAHLAEPYETAAGILHRTASIGVAVSWPGASESSLVERADRAMYQAKSYRPGPV